MFTLPPEVVPELPPVVPLLLLDEHAVTPIAAAVAKAAIATSLVRRGPMLIVSSPSTLSIDPIMSICSLDNS